jgi:hypothetical protein
VTSGLSRARQKSYFYEFAGALDPTLPRLVLVTGRLNLDPYGGR